MRLCTDNFAVEVLDSVMGTLFTTAAIPVPTEDGRPLFKFTEEDEEASSGGEGSSGDPAA